MSNQYHYDSNWIDGNWIKSSSSDRYSVINPSTSEIIGTVPLSSEIEVNLATQAAKKALSSWQRTPPNERSSYIQALYEKCIEYRDALAHTISLEMGMPYPLSQAIQLGMPITTFKDYAELIPTYPFTESIESATIYKEPIGVCALITPWNFPLHQIAAKLAPALGSGCTVVIKPSEETPLVAMELAKIIEEIQLPKGVCNIITGLGNSVGESLVNHPDIDMISFTGSTQVGKRIETLAASQLKRVCHELGGKSASVVLDHTDLETIIPKCVHAANLNSGQTCSAPTRLIIPKKHEQEVYDIAIETVKKYVMSDPFETNTTHGPIVHQAQYEKVLNLIQTGIDEGANLLIGGTKKPSNNTSGFFVAPTIFGNVSSKMTIAQEEIFGPVLSILSYTNESEAIQIANDTRYGLSGAVFASTDKKAIEVARQIKTGQIGINDTHFSMKAPFGGCKQSGNSRELGVYGLDDYIELRSLLFGSVI